MSNFNLADFSAMTKANTRVGGVREKLEYQFRVRRADRKVEGEMTPVTTFAIGSKQYDKLGLAAAGIRPFTIKNANGVVTALLLGVVSEEDALHYKALQKGKRKSETFKSSELEKAFIDLDLMTAEGNTAVQYEMELVAENATVDEVPCTEVYTLVNGKVEGEDKKDEATPPPVANVAEESEEEEESQEEKQPVAEAAGEAPADSEEEEEDPEGW